MFFHKTQLKRDIAIFKREIGVIRGLDSRSEWQEERLQKMRQKEEEQERQLELYDSWVIKAYKKGLFIKFHIEKGKRVGRPTTTESQEPKNKGFT